MPHLRLQVAEEWLTDEFKASTGFDAHALLDHLVKTISEIRMEKPGTDPVEMVPLINLSNLKHAIEPLRYAHVAGDTSKRFLHCTFSMGNEMQGRTAAVRSRAALTLGNEIDRLTEGLPGLASVTVQIQDIDRDRGYTTTAERRKLREAK